MSEYFPKFKPGAAITYDVSAPVQAGQMVEITGPRTVAPASAASTKVVGVAGFDAAVTDKVTVYRGGVQTLRVAAAVTAGDQVEAAPDGMAVSGEDAVIGIALTDADADGLADVMWTL